MPASLPQSWAALLDAPPSAPSVVEVHHGTRQEFREWFLVEVVFILMFCIYPIILMTMLALGLLDFEELLFVGRPYRTVRVARLVVGDAEAAWLPRKDASTGPAMSALLRWARARGVDVVEHHPDGSSSRFEVAHPLWAAAAELAAAEAALREVGGEVERDGALILRWKEPTSGSSGSDVPLRTVRIADGVLTCQSSWGATRGTEESVPLDQIVAVHLTPAPVADGQVAGVARLVLLTHDGEMVVTATNRPGVVSAVADALLAVLCADPLPAD